MMKFPKPKLKNSDRTSAPTDANLPQSAFQRFMRSSLVVAMAVIALAGSSMLTGCGPKAFVRGEYEDPQEENNLNDLWSETDMQKVVADLVASMINHNEIANAKRPPLVMITKLQNKTGEVIDTQNVMDMVRVELSRGGRVAFVNREAREDVAAEYEYQGSGMVSEESKKGKGGQLGADFIIDGRLDSIVQQAGKDKTVYYKVTLQLTNLKTNVIAWTDYKQIRKKYRKQSVGL
ncbi:MAG TPA: penicillin-binding protein activator LpoB [Pseudobdellovibrionaceae bacterium]|nr:penicillin-binding protein activator LpoB [Pseudobdellovibrionaceae bacterium]